VLLHAHCPSGCSAVVKPLALPRQHHACLPGERASCRLDDTSMLSAAALLFTELLLVGWAESKRLADYNNPGSQGDGSFFGITDGLKGQDNGYPGQFAAPFCQ